MNIQKIRYKNSFAIDFSIEEEILHCCTVKLVVQPLLEMRFIMAWKEWTVKARSM